MKARTEEKELFNKLTYEFVFLINQLQEFNIKCTTDDAEAQEHRAGLEAKIAACREQLLPLRNDLDKFEAIQRGVMARIVSKAQEERRNKAAVENSGRVESSKEVNGGKLTSAQTESLNNRVNTILKEYANSYSRHHERVTDLLNNLKFDIEVNYRILRKLRFPEVKDNVLELYIRPESKLRSTPNVSLFATTLGLFCPDAYPDLLDKCLAIYCEPEFTCEQMACLLNDYALPAKESNKLSTGKLL